MAYPSMTDGAILIAWDGSAALSPALLPARSREGVGAGGQDAPDLSRPT
jgi:hypothetical protein